MLGRSDGQITNSAKRFARITRIEIIRAIRAKRFVSFVFSKVMPTLALERQLRARGFSLIAGIDEVGRGAWAGPVVAAAVMLPLDDGRSLRRQLKGVNDSKQLTPGQRERLYPRICETAVAVGVGLAGPDEVDRDGILPATRAAMSRAVTALGRAPDHLLIDAVRLPLALPQTSIVKGDVLSLSIAAASIVAKVTRDRLMRELERQYPGYGFAQHKGYGTPQHRQALERLGVSRVHRRSYAPIAIRFPADLQGLQDPAGLG